MYHVAGENLRICDYKHKVLVSLQAGHSRLVDKAKIQTTATSQRERSLSSGTSQEYWSAEGSTQVRRGQENSCD